MTISLQDALDGWTHHAHRRATALNLPVPFIEEARDIVVGALGRDWLEKEFRRAPKGLRLVLDGHPVVENLLVAGDPQVVQVMELAVYLKRLSAVKGLNEVLTMMRERGQFQTTLLQLAYAYRFSRAGARVWLEPDSDGGRKSDIGLEIDRREILAECYVPAFGRKSSLMEVVEYSCPKLFRAATSIGLTVRLGFVFRREPHEGERSTLENAVQVKLPNLAGGGQVMVDLGWVTVDAVNISGVSPDPDYPDPTDDKPISVPRDGDSIWAETRVHMGDLDRVRDGSGASVLRGSRALFRWPKTSPISVSAREEELKRRFDEKLAQTKKPGAGRILIAQIREGETMTPEDEVVARRVGERLLGRHVSIVVVILTTRVWTTRNRFRYQGYALHGRNEAAVPSRFVDTLNDIDGVRDVLEDC